MNMLASLAGFAPNPLFGNGYFVRATAMRRLAPDRLEVVMEDSAHALAMVLTHDADTLLGVEARWRRRPMSSCAGAEAFLATVAGTPLSADVRALGLRADARAHCTHLFDTCRLGIAHIARERPDRRYDVVVPDTASGPQPVRLLVDGAVALDLTIDMATTTVIAPTWLEGAPLMRGFAAWAQDRLTDEAYERLVLVQRGVFVSAGRRVDMTRYDGVPAAMLGPPEGSCFASQPHRYRDAVRDGGLRPALTIEEALDFGFATAAPPAHPAVADSTSRSAARTSTSKPSR